MKPAARLALQYLPDLISLGIVPLVRMIRARRAAKGKAHLLTDEQLRTLLDQAGPAARKLIQRELSRRARGQK